MDEHQSSALVDVEENYVDNEFVSGPITDMMCWNHVGLVRKNDKLSVTVYFSSIFCENDAELRKPMKIAFSPNKIYSDQEIVLAELTDDAVVLVESFEFEGKTSHIVHCTLFRNWMSKKVTWTFHFAGKSCQLVSNIKLSNYIIAVFMEDSTVIVLSISGKIIDSFIADNKVVFANTFNYSLLVCEAVNLTLSAKTKNYQFTCYDCAYFVKVMFRVKLKLFDDSIKNVFLTPNEAVPAVLTNKNYIYLLDPSKNWIKTEIFLDEPNLNCHVISVFMNPFILYYYDMDAQDTRKRNVADDLKSLELKLPMYYSECKNNLTEHVENFFLTSFSCCETINYDEIFLLDAYDCYEHKEEHLLNKYIEECNMKHQIVAYDMFRLIQSTENKKYALDYANQKNLKNLVEQIELVLNNNLTFSSLFQNFLYSICSKKYAPEYAVKIRPNLPVHERNSLKFCDNSKMSLTEVKNLLREKTQKKSNSENTPLSQTVDKQKVKNILSRLKPK